MPIALVGGLVSGLGALGGGFMQSNAAKGAARQQAAATNKALDYQALAYLDVANKLAPFLQGGTDAFLQLLGMSGIMPGGENNPEAFFQLDPRVIAGLGDVPVLGDLGAPPDPNDPNLRNKFLASPGYQYQLEQMGDAIQNSAAGRTGAVSGNMMRELQKNAQGLASGDWWNNYGKVVESYGLNRNNVLDRYKADYGSWMDQYGLARNRQGDLRNLLAGLAGIGQNAAVQQGGFGQSAANNMAPNLNLLGSAQAAGTLGSANAFSNMFNSPSFQGSINNLTSWLTGPSSPFGSGSYPSMNNPSSPNYTGGLW